MDGAIAKIADQHIPFQRAEAGRRQCHAPGGIEYTRRCKATDEVAVEIENVDITQAGTGDFVVHCTVPHRVRDVQLALQCHNAECDKAGWYCRVDKLSLHVGWLGKVGIEYVDLAIVQVGRIEKRRVIRGAKGEPLVDSVPGAVGNAIVVCGNSRRTAVLGPRGDRSALTVENEQGWLVSGACRNQKA